MRAKHIVLYVHLYIFIFFYNKMWTRFRIYINVLFWNTLDLFLAISHIVILKFFKEQHAYLYIWYHLKLIIRHKMQKLNWSVRKTSKMIVHLHLMIKWYIKHVIAILVPKDKYCIANKLVNFSLSVELNINFLPGVY
jgi:hypothetical protein